MLYGVMKCDVAYVKIPLIDVVTAVPFSGKVFLQKPQNF